MRLRQDMLVLEIEVDSCKVVIVFALSHSAASLLELVTVVRFLCCNEWNLAGVAYTCDGRFSWIASTCEVDVTWLLWSFGELARLSSKKAPTLVSELARATNFLLLSSGAHHLRIWLRRRWHAQTRRSRVSTVVERTSVVFLLAVGAIPTWSCLSLTRLS